MLQVILIIVGFIAGLLSGSVGFGGGIFMIPFITYFFGIEVAIPVSTIAQLLSNVSRVGMGFRQIDWKSVWNFLVPALPFTALGAYGFSIVPKEPMTAALAIFLIIFSIMKLKGKMNLPKKSSTMLIGGGITGLLNGLVGVSGPLSSACFLTLDLAPISYIASEATCSAMMHVVKVFVYGKLDLMNKEIFLYGLLIGVAMIVGNFIAMRFIKNVEKKKYQKIVAAIMIVVSSYLLISSII